MTPRVKRPVDLASSCVAYYCSRATLLPSSFGLLLHMRTVDIDSSLYFGGGGGGVATEFAVVVTRAGKRSGSGCSRFFVALRL